MKKMKDTIFYNCSIQDIEFFNFRYQELGGTVIKAEYIDEGKVVELPTSVGQEIARINDKYQKLKRHDKEHTKARELYNKEREDYLEKKKRMQEHIIRAEQKLSEYKNVILAFGKLAK